jgi:hypothetical protein
MFDASTQALGLRPVVGLGILSDGSQIPTPSGLSWCGVLKLCSGILMSILPFDDPKCIRTMTTRIEAYLPVNSLYPIKMLNLLLLRLSVFLLPCTNMFDSLKERASSSLTQALPCLARTPELLLGSRFLSPTNPDGGHVDKSLPPPLESSIAVTNSTLNPVISSQTDTDTDTDTNPGFVMWRLRSLRSRRRSFSYAMGLIRANGQGANRTAGPGRE